MTCDDADHDRPGNQDGEYEQRECRNRPRVVVGGRMAVPGIPDAMKVSMRL